MAASQLHINANTPMGANLIGDGATFRVWAPNAKKVYVALNGIRNYTPKPEDELSRSPHGGHWTGFIPGVSDGTKYRYYVLPGVGEGRLKRDPWAREMELHDWPNVDCLVRDSNSYPWHDAGHAPPHFHSLIVYQLHVGVFYAVDQNGRDIRKGRVSKFLDMLGRVKYLADLGVNALQLLPVTEFQTPHSQGYNSTDIYSPEMDYSVDPSELPQYLPLLNQLLQEKGHAPVDIETLTPQVNQLKALIDVCHLWGISVLFDVVYNHAGGSFDEASIDFFDLDSTNLYFTVDYVGGRVFDYSRPEVCDFLISNAEAFFYEYHVDGLRFDEVSLIDQFGGWRFCQDLTSTLRYTRPDHVKISEYWGGHSWLSLWQPPDGMGFDISYSDKLRDGIRTVIAQAAGGANADVHLDRLQPGLERPWNFPKAYQAYNCIENHDFVMAATGGNHGSPRIPKLAVGGGETRTWYARSRARVAMGLLLTAPGVPMLFMGMEIYEDKLWLEDSNRTECQVWWDGLKSDRDMSDFHFFTRDLIWLRRRLPALQSEPIRVFHINELDRVISFHRWVDGEGRDLVIVVSLREQTFYDHSYQLGFPFDGQWNVVFDSDYYEQMPNPSSHGNPGGVTANGPPLHGFNHSAGITLPANSMLIFQRG